jgi:hypothetical protein
VLGGAEIGVSEDLGSDMDREAAGDSLGGEHAPEVVEAEAERGVPSHLIPQHPKHH